LDEKASIKMFRIYRDNEWIIFSTFFMQEKPIVVQKSVLKLILIGGKVLSGIKRQKI